MIDSINLTEFRGVQSTESRIDLSDFTILIGRNNAGKSSILQAIYLIFGGKDPILGVNKGERIQKLHHSKLVYRYSGEGTIESTSNNKVCETRVFPDRVHRVNIGQYETSSANSTMLKEMNIDAENANQATMMFTPSYDSYLSILRDLQGERDAIEKSELHAKAAEFINQSIGDEYTEIYLESMEMRKKPTEGEPFWIDVTDLGSGVLKALTIFLAVEYIDPAIFVWDDMETSLHPSLLRDILEFLIEKDIQVVASTHSIDVLSTLLDLQPPDASIIQVSKSKDDILTHESLDIDELVEVMDLAGLDPRYLADDINL